MPLMVTPVLLMGYTTLLRMCGGTSSALHKTAPSCKGQAAMHIRAAGVREAAHERPSAFLLLAAAPLRPTMYR